MTFYFFFYEFIKRIFIESIHPSICPAAHYGREREAREAAEREKAAAQAYGQGSFHAPPHGHGLAPQYDFVGGGDADQASLRLSLPCLQKNKKTKKKRTNHFHVDIFHCHFTNTHDGECVWVGMGD